jgi:hypothetical protein
MNMEFAANVAPACFLVVSLVILCKAFVQSRRTRFRAGKVSRIHFTAR